MVLCLLGDEAMAGGQISLDDNRDAIIRGSCSIKWDYVGCLWKLFSTLIGIRTQRDSSRKIASVSEYTGCP